MAVLGRLQPSGGLNSSRSQLCEGPGNKPHLQWDRVVWWLSHRDERFMPHPGLACLKDRRATVVFAGNESEEEGLR